MLASTADQLLLIFRDEVSDVSEPHLWSDTLAYVYMTEGADALANEGQALYKVLRLNYTAGEPVVPLPASVLQIRNARDTATNRAIYPSNTNAQDLVPFDDYGNFASTNSAMFEGSGPVCQYVRDYDRKALHLVPAPAIDGTIELQCTVTLSVPLVDGAPLPYTEAKDQRLILHYMKWRAYSKHDAETEDLVRAKENEQAFRLGVRDREVQMRKYRRSPGVVRMSGW